MAPWGAVLKKTALEGGAELSYGQLKSSPSGAIRGNGSPFSWRVFLVDDHSQSSSHYNNRFMFTF